MNTTKTTKKAPTNKKFGAQRGNKRSRVVGLRNKGFSWAAIALELDIAPRTARRLFDEKMGNEAHYASRIPGKGGRVRAAA